MCYIYFLKWFFPIELYSIVHVYVLLCCSTVVNNSSKNIEMTGYIDELKV